MAQSRATITAEEWALGLTGVGLMAGGLYLLNRDGIIHLPGLPSSTAKQKVPSALNIAPQNLPSIVPTAHRCGTVYVSFGASTSRSGSIIVGKYTNGKLVAQYYQAATDAPNFNAAGSWTGGYACTTAVSHTPVTTQRTTPTPSNVYGWKFTGTKTVNGQTAKCYVAQNGATLSGLQVITGVYYGTIASQNGISNPSQIQIGQTVCVTPSSAASTPKTTPRGFPALNVATQTLPSSVTSGRCGTVYYSYGMSSVSGYAVIAKYTNGKLVAQYYQAASSTSPWRNKGYHTGGYACAVTTAQHPGYFSVGYKYGLPLLAPSIPTKWPLNTAIPYASPLLNHCVWLFIKHPLNKNTGQPVSNLYTVASYNQDGTWTGKWEIITTAVGTAPFVANCNPLINWPYLS